MDIQRIFPVPLDLSGEYPPGIRGKYVYRKPNWGMIEGVVYEGGVPVPPGVPVACCWGDESLCVQEIATTTAGGIFLVGPLPCREVGVGRWHGPLPGDTADEGEDVGSADVERRVGVVPGKVISVALGAGPGRIQGRLVMPETFSARLPRLWLECLGPHPDPALITELEYSNAWRDLDDEREEYLESHEVDPAHHRWYLLALSPEGEFARGGILPGLYGLQLELEVAFDPLGGPIAIGILRCVIDGEHDLGDVEVSQSALEGPGTARIQGRLWIDGAPARGGEEVGCTTSDLGPRSWTSVESSESGQWFATTDDEGRFCFEAIPAGLATLGHVIRHKVDAVSTVVLAELVVRSGEDVEIELGKQRRTGAWD